jgi:hypothetical protein
MGAAKGWRRKASTFADAAPSFPAQHHDGTGDSMKLQIAGAAGGTLVVAGLVAGMLALNGGQATSQPQQQPVVIDAAAQAVDAPQAGGGRPGQADEGERKPLGELIAGPGGLVFYGVKLYY